MGWQVAGRVTDTSLSAHDPLPPLPRGDRPEALHPTLQRRARGLRIARHDRLPEVPEHRRHLDEMKQEYDAIHRVLKKLG